MASNAGGIKVTAPSLGPVQVNLTTAGGVGAVVYSDPALTVSVPLPTVVAPSATKTLYFPTAGSYTMSLSIAGEEFADPLGRRAISIDVGPGALGVYDLTWVAFRATPTPATTTSDVRTPVFAGDSIMSMATSGSVGHLAFAGAAALGLLNVGSVSSATPSIDAGVGGNTSTQLLARFGTDVIAKNPHFVHILIGTNDAGGSVPVSTFAANIRSMVAQCQAIGARVVLGTVPPNGTGSPANRKAMIIAYNQWLCRYAIANQIPIADYYRVLVDTTTGGYQAAYDFGDGTHPSPAGTGVMAAELLAATTRPLSASLLLTKDSNDPNNFAANGLWISSWATAWAQTGSPTGVTASTTTGDTNIQGNWGKLAAVASSGTAEWNQSRTTTQGGTAYVVGNWHTWLCRAASTALSAAQTQSIRARFVNQGSFDLNARLTHIAYSGPGGLIVGQEGQSPATTTGMQSDIQLSTGTGDLSVAQFTVYDLTGMGVTDVNGVLV